MSSLQQRITQWLNESDECSIRITHSWFENYGSALVARLPRPLMMADAVTAMGVSSFVCADPNPFPPLRFWSRRRAA